AVEQALHVLDRVDGHAGLAHVAPRALVAAVVAAMRRQIEGHAQALLTAGQALLVERVRLFGGREARILANGPGPARVHAGAPARALPRARFRRRGVSDREIARSRR